MHSPRLPALLILVLASLHGLAAEPPHLEPLHYNHPGLTVDLSVGLWADPLPMDFDGDGHLDLVVNCPDKPYNGLYFFRNASGDTTGNPFPVFQPARRISGAFQNVQVSYLAGGSMDNAKVPDGEPIQVHVPHPAE